MYPAISGNKREREIEREREKSLAKDKQALQLSAKTKPMIKASTSGPEEAARPAPQPERALLCSALLKATMPHGLSFESNYYLLPLS